MPDRLWVISSPNVRFVMTFVEYPKAQTCVAAELHVRKGDVVMDHAGNLSSAGGRASIATARW